MKRPFPIHMHVWSNWSEQRMSIFQFKTCIICNKIKSRMT